MAFLRNRNLIIFMMFGSIIALVVHFAIITAYGFRDQLPVSATKITDRYCVPMFHQNWKLFAPDLPKYDAQLAYRYNRDQSWSEWNDITESCGFTRFSKMETIEQGFNTQLAWQVVNNYYARDGRAQFDRMVQSPAYANSLFYVLKMHQLHVDSIKPDSVQIKLKFVFTPPPDQAHSIQSSELAFPVYAPI